MRTRSGRDVLQCLPLLMLPWYIGTTMKTPKSQKKFVIERVQTGVRMEKRLLKVLKALAEFHDLTLGDLLEGIVLHAFDGKTAFQKPSRKRIKELKRFYGLDLDSRASHRLIEARDPNGPRKARRGPMPRGTAKVASVGTKKAASRRIDRSAADRRTTKRKRHP
jgi:hypothetical protein